MTDDEFLNFEPLQAMETDSRAQEFESLVYKTFKENPIGQTLLEQLYELYVIKPTGASRATRDPESLR